MVRDSNPLAGLRPMTEDFAIEQPEPIIDDSDEKRKKSISRTKRWKEFKIFIDGRRKLYEKQLPGGTYFKYMPKEDAATYTNIANLVIEEMDIWTNFLEGGDL